MLAGNEFEEFGGDIIPDDPFAEFGGEKIPANTKGIVPTSPIKPISKDNTIVKNQSIPINNTQQAIQASKKMIGVNQLAQERDAYYNPEVRDLKSGDKSLDLLYKNQWLMDVPGIGDYIKNKAYDVAKSSSGMETLDNKQLSDIQNKKQIKVPQLNSRYDKPGYDTAYVDAPIKNYTGQDLTQEKKNPINLLDQYFGKIQLPESKYKPTSDYLSFLPSVSIKGDFEKSGNKDMSKWIDYIKTMSAASKGIDKNSLDYNKQPIYYQDGNDSPISIDLGTNLNGHKLSVAYDKNKKLPYVSVSDAWDFEPNSYAKKDGMQGSQQEHDRAYVQASLMHKAGKPFKVYDRFYFDPKTNKYIPDAQVLKKK